MFVSFIIYVLWFTMIAFNQPVKQKTNFHIVDIKDYYCYFKSH